MAHLTPLITSSLASLLESPVGTLLALLVLWATLLLGFAWLLSAILYRASSAVRYCMWQFALMGLLIVPAICLLLPGVPLGITLRLADPKNASADDQHSNMQRTTALASADTASSAIDETSHYHPLAASPTHASYPQTQPQSAMGQAQTEAGNESMGQSREPVMDVTTDTATVTAGPRHSDATRIPWTNFVATIWGAGVFAQLAWLAWCMLRARRLAQHAIVLQDDRIVRILAALVQRISLSQSIRLLVSSELRVPLVVGIREARILLPTSCAGWSTERIRIVLSHELAHVERRDVFWQLAARAAAALYWFHPLVWLAVRRMREERERACDDRVLVTGVEPVDYAAALVEVAAELTGRKARLAGAIGMAEQLALEDRVRSILDRSLTRNPASARARRMLLAGTAGLVLLLGILRPFTPVTVKTVQALDATATNTADHSEAEKATGSSPTTSSSPIQLVAQAPGPVREKIAHTKGSMLIRVVSVDGQPCAGAAVHTGIWTDEKDFKSKRDYVCDEQGQVVIELPKTLEILRVWASSDGYAPMFVNWEPKEQPDGHLLPDEFTFHMNQGTAIGGFVRNDDSEPIRGAQVDVRYDGQGVQSGPSTRAQFSTWLANNDDAATTDAEGRWTLNNVPAGDDVKLTLKIRHPDYINDSKWGGLQKEQFVTTVALRDQTAVIKMHRGFTVTGTVTDPDGKPVKNAVVIWGDRPYWETGSQEVLTDELGMYRVPPLPAGPKRVTVVAQGWMPQQTKIQIAGELTPVNFSMKPGKQLRVRFVDKNGAPVPGVYVGIKEWRGTESLYNDKHSNVRDTNIPRLADENGIYEWTWAPDDAVTYRCSKEGFAEAQPSLTADGSEQVVTMHTRLHITGTVVDANTGQPIEKFLAAPIIHFSPDFPSVEHEMATACTDGKFDVQFDRTDIEHGVQIEASGYETLRAGPYRIGDEVAPLALRMKPARRFTGRVVNAVGQPVSHARVYVGSYSEHLYLSDLHAEDGGRSSNYWVTTNDAGEFEIAHQLERYALVVVSNEGYAEGDRSVNAMPGELIIRPWANVSGQLVQHEKPVRNWDVNLVPIREQGGDAPRGHFGLYIKTADDGSFVFDRVPPVPLNVQGYLHWSVDGPLSSSGSVPLTPKPGEQIHVSLGSGGAEVTGQLALDPASPDFDYHFSLNYLVARKPGITPPPAVANKGFDSSKGWSDSWSSSTEGFAYLQTLHHHFVKPDPDGRFRISGVAPGDYDLALRLYGSTEGCLAHPVGLAIVRVKVAEGQTSLELGTVKVPSIANLAVGDAAPAFEFEGLDGAKHTLADSRGKYVLIDFWATWCSPCVAKIPQVEATRQKFADRPGLVVVGANLDQDKDRAVAFLRQRKLPWKHALLGDWSDTDVPKQFAVASVPTYVLISPDGQVLAHESTLEAIEAILDQK